MSQRGNRGNKVPERSQALLVSSCQIAYSVFIPGDRHTQKLVNVTGTEKRMLRRTNTT